MPDFAFSELLQTTFLNNTLRLWVVALLTAVGFTLAVWLGRWLLLNRFQKLARRTSTDIDDVAILLIQRISKTVVVLLALYVGALLLTLPTAVDAWISAFAFAVLMVQAGIWGDSLIHHWLSDDRDRILEQDAARATTMNAIGIVARFILYAILVLLALDNIPGVEVTALVASLGIGGVAVALAVQNILGDLFASLSIMLDKPFVIGDFIIVGDFLGSVQHIGLKTTRVRSLTGEELIFSNSDLLNSRLRNYKDMEERRVAVGFGVTYDTPPHRLRQIPDMVTEIIQGLETVRFDRAHFKDFGDFALNFEVVYYVLDADYNLYMDVQQAINLAILEQFDEAGIDMAYPTQTLYVANLDDTAVVGKEAAMAGNGRG